MKGNNTLLIGLGVLVLIAVAYLTFFNKPDETADLASDSIADSAAELYFVNLAGTLDPIAFDTQVLADPRFVSLVDLSTAIVPENRGRIDPFAPIAGAAR